MSTFVKTSFQNHVARVVIDRRDVHNAFNDVVIAELRRAFEEAGARDDVRIVVLAGEGPSFSAGADMNWMKSMVDYTFEENVADSTKMAHMLRAIRECPKVTIARVHGPTFGGGVGLTAACDLAVALKDAVFALTEVKLGILPAVISPYVQEKIGAGQMRRYALTAERFDAMEARRMRRRVASNDIASARRASAPEFPARMASPMTLRLASRQIASGGTASGLNRRIARCVCTTSKKSMICLVLAV